jgi:hypothetical protein
MAKRKSTKGQTRSRKHIYKTKDRVKRTPLKQIALQIYANKCSGKIKCMVIALTVNPFTAFDDSDYTLWYPQA